MYQSIFVFPRITEQQWLQPLIKSFCELKMMMAVLLPGKVKYDPQGRRRNDKLMFFWARWKTAVKRTWVKVLFSNEDISLSEKRGRIVFLNVSLILFFFRLPHSEEAQILTCIHTCCLAGILAFTRYTQLPPFSASGPCEPNTNSPHPHMNTQPTMTSFKDNHSFPSPVPDLVLWCTFGNISLKHTPRDHPDSAMVLNLCHN